MTIFDRLCDLLFGYPKTLFQRLVEQWTGAVLAAIVIYQLPTWFFMPNRVGAKTVFATLGAMILACRLASLIGSSALAHLSGAHRSSAAREARAFCDEVMRLGHTRIVLIVGVLGGGLAFGLLMFAVVLRTIDVMNWPRQLDQVAALCLVGGFAYGLVKGSFVWTLATRLRDGRIF